MKDRDIVLGQRILDAHLPPPEPEAFAVVAGEAIGGRQPDVTLPIDGEVVDHPRQAVFGAEADEARLDFGQARGRNRENCQQRAESGHCGQHSAHRPA